jgi:hypothetical protein
MPDDTEIFLLAYWRAGDALGKCSRTEFLSGIADDPRGVPKAPDPETNQRWTTRDAFKKALQRAESRYRDDSTFAFHVDRAMRFLMLASEGHSLEHCAAIASTLPASAFRWQQAAPTIPNGATEEA